MSNNKPITFTADHSILATVATQHPEYFTDAWKVHRSTGNFVVIASTQCYDTPAEYINGQMNSNGNQIHIFDLKPLSNPNLYFYRAWKTDLALSHPDLSDKDMTVMAVMDLIATMAVMQRESIANGQIPLSLMESLKALRDVTPEEYNVVFLVSAAIGEGKDQTNVYHIFTNAPEPTPSPYKH